MKIILGIDALELGKALDIVSALRTRIHGVKVHSRLDRNGAQTIKILKLAGSRNVFVDLKLADTEDSVADRVKAWLDHGADIITVHATSGLRGMYAARKAAPDLELWAVTLLTSKTEDEILYEYGQPPEQVVYNYAAMAKLAGMDGIVCAASDTKKIFQDDGFKNWGIMIPGIRGEGEKRDCQARASTPAQAVNSGATHIVVARKVMLAPDPIAAFERIEQTILEAEAAQKAAL